MRVKTEGAEPPARSFITDARRAQIVAAAIETVAELGYPRASFARIAERAGLSSVRLISYHFDGKEDLFQAVVDAVQDEARAFMQPRIRAHEDPAAMLAAYIESNLDFMAEQPAKMRALVDVLANARDADGEPLVSSAGFDTPMALLVQHLRNGQAAGVFRSFDAEAVATAIRAAIDAAANRLAGGDAFDAAAYGRELSALFLRGIVTGDRP